MMNIKALICSLLSVQTFCLYSVKKPDFFTILSREKNLVASVAGERNDDGYRCFLLTKTIRRGMRPQYTYRTTMTIGTDEDHVFKEGHTIVISFGKNKQIRFPVISAQTMRNGLVLGSGRVRRL